MPSKVSTFTGDQSVEALRRELAEAREQQAATAEILSSISSSVTDANQVFAKIAASAARLCDAYDATVFQLDGDFLHPIAHYGPIPQGGALPLKRGFITVRVILDRQTIHISDMQAETDEFPEGSDIARRLGFRTILAVPLIRAGAAIGVISIRRTEVKLFSDRQITLLETFADQAVIAIENTRLFEAVQASKRELSEALEQQTATADVLKVISRSALDLRRALDALVETAARLCNAYDAVIFQVFGDGMRLVAHHGQIPLAGPLQQHTVPLVPGLIAARAIIDRRTIHVADALLADADGFPESRKNALQQGFRTVLAVPLVHAGEAIGVILIRRAEVRPFTERQIELVNTFADQAVIAIENTRLFEEVQARTKELQDSLDRQTATSEVQGVISRSPNEVQPVLDTIVATAQRLCQAERAVVWRLEDETFRAVAHHGQPEERVESVLSARAPLSRGSMSGRATLARRAVQVEDVATDPELVAASRALNQALNIHTVLAVPLLLKGYPIGAITLARTRIAPFDDKQVALVEAFADQAVIAIENSRLFEAEQASKRELTESLEQQTATADVLKAISRSALDVQKVLDALVESAARLCDALDAAIFQVDGRSLRLVAAQVQSFPPGSVGFTSFPLLRGYVMGRAVIDRRTIHVADMLAEAYEYPESHKTALELGFRTLLTVPLVHAGEAIGVIVRS